MSEVYYFSASNLGFYAGGLKVSFYDPAGAWPDDCLKLTDDEFMQYSGQAPEGKILGADKKGNPAWVDAPKPTKEELTEQAQLMKAQLMTEAAAKIAPLQDAVDEEMATDSEIAELSAWKKYRVLVNRIDTSSSKIDWPVKPE